MEIDTSIVGFALSPMEREVSWRDTMNYAAAVGDLDPRYLDDTREGGVVAPPLFAVAVTWPLVTALSEGLGDALRPEIVATMVHASERLVFHRPIRPRDRLRLTGRVAALVSTPAGAHLVLRIDAADAGGSPVFTELNGAIFRGVACKGEDRGRESLPDTPRWEEPPAPLWAASIPVARQAAHVYDGCTDIVFPIHTSAAFARSVGLPDIILQGTAALALAAREILDREAAGEPARLKEIGCRFAGMVIPGTSVSVELSAREERQGDSLLGFRVLDEGGNQALKQGFARVARR